jgi:hypothetical protein
VVKIEEPDSAARLPGLVIDVNVDD